MVRAEESVGTALFLLILFFHCFSTLSFFIPSFLMSFHVFFMFLFFFPDALHACRASSGHGYCSYIGRKPQVIMVDENGNALDDFAQSRFEKQLLQVLSARGETSSHCVRTHQCARPFSHLSRISSAPQDALFTFEHGVRLDRQSHF